LLIGFAATALAGDPAPALTSALARIEFAAGLPSRWLSCEPACADDGARHAELLGGNSDTTLSWYAPGRPALAEEFAAARYRVDLDADGLTLRSREPLAGRYRSHRYRLDSASGVLEAKLDLPDGLGLAWTAGEAFIPESLPGFGSIYTRVRAVQLTDQGQESLLDEQTAATLTLAAGDWGGIRQRFWAMLVSSDSEPTQLAVSSIAENQPRVVFMPATGATMQLYAGPVDWHRLGRVDPVLREMLFAALWDWLRWLCVGMLVLLGWLQSLVGNSGLTVILLSLSVKILMYPLTRIADAWQAEVNRTQALLQPKLDAIKREYRGEEAHNRVLQVYKEHGVHPMYSLRSLAGFLIQIPIFIAAFDMLGENFALHEARFLWIDDLARPDRILPLGFVLPFFGGQLNLLPFLMTGFTLLASMLQAQPDLTPALERQQQLKLSLMAAAFFVLFYTFPAGMVLYWTTNNVLHLLKILPASVLGGGRAIGP